jgi:uncharacterized membrane protein YfcA
MTPILVLAFGQSPSVAVGTDLLFACLTKVAGSGSFGLAGRVEWRIVGRLALGSLPAAGLVLVLLHGFSGHASYISEDTILSGLAGLLVVTGLGLLTERLWRPTLSLENATTPRAHSTLATVIVGALLGVAVTLTSVGAGALGTVGLFYLYPRLSTDRLVGTDLAHAVPLTLMAGLGHASLGHVDITILTRLLLGSVPAVLIASRIAVRLPQRMLRLLVALMLAIVGTKILTGH